MNATYPCLDAILEQTQHHKLLPKDHHQAIPSQGAKKYYANISLYLYKLAPLTGQLEENIVFQINQKIYINPADLLGKFDFDKDHVSQWMELAQKVLHPPWLQNNPDTYFRNMMEESDNKIRELMERNHNKQTVHTDHTLVHECTELKQGGDLMVNFINVQDRFTPVRNKTVDFQPLETIVDKNKFRGSNFRLKVMGYVTWIARHWRDRVYLKKNATCNHQYLCPCKKNCQQIDRLTDSSWSHQ